MQTNHQQLLDGSTKTNSHPARTSNRSFTARTLRLAIIVAAILVGADYARGDWTFAILGDTRGEHYTTTGVGSNVNAIATMIASLQPDLVLVSGDLCNGNATHVTNPPSYAQMFDTWKAAMSPVTAAGIPIYPVRGNHENEAGEAAPIPELKQAYYDAFGAFMPTNGPNNGTNDDQGGFTYSFVHSNATFVALDQYFYFDHTPQTGYHSIDQTWLDQQLRQATTPYVVVMAHEPSFTFHFYGTNTTARSEFWDSHGDNGVRLFICGHLHQLNVSVAPDGAGNQIYQLLSGNGGAPLSASADPAEELMELYNDAGATTLFTNETCYGFALATVGTNFMTINYYLLDPASNTWSKAAYTTTITANAPVVDRPATGRGEWRILDHPNAVATFPRGISGDKIVGIYYPTPSQSHGFVYDGKTWTDIDVPGAPYTIPCGISGKKIVGNYYTDPAAQNWYSFVYDGKHWMTFDIPGAVATHAYGIEGNSIVGYFFTGHADRGFLYEGTTWTAMDAPQAFETFVNGISGHALVGDYVDRGTYAFRGFLYQHGNWTSLDAPGAEATYCWGISGDLVVGHYWQGPPGDHGFLYNRAAATWTTLDFPGAKATQPFGIDEHGIVGDFKVGQDTHGFLYNLAPAGRSAHAEGWVIGTYPASGYGVILHTANGGYQWDRQGSANEIPNVSLNNVKAVDRHTAWVVGHSDSGYGLILRTEDGGQTWVRQGGPGRIPDVAMFGVGAANRKTGWAVGGEGTILRTDDEGRTWTRQKSGTTANLYEVAVIDSKIAWAIGDTDNGYAVVLHTTDGGRTWERQGTAATLGAKAFIDVTAVNPRTAWAVGIDSSVAKTTDGGESWEIQMGQATGPHNNGVCGVDPKAAWIATDYNTVYRTTNGGTAWGRQDMTGRVLGNYYLLGVSALDRDTAWVVGGANHPPDTGIILHTTDGGDTWGIQETPVNVTFRRASFVGSLK